MPNNLREQICERIAELFNEYDVCNPRLANRMLYLILENRAQEAERMDERAIPAWITIARKNRADNLRAMKE